MTHVSIKDVRVKFANVTVFDGLNLEIDNGEFLVLLGPSGCGKSTLLNAVAGLLDIADGSVIIGGKDVTWAQPKDRNIAMVFQSYALYPRMTVRENMGFGLKIAKFNKQEITKRVDGAAEILQIAHLLNRRPDQLSGGQRQRVAIGRAIVRDAGLFLFDEPLSNLDAQLRSELRLEIKRLHKRLSSTIMYVTHDQVEAMTLADRVVVLKDQHIQQIGTPAEIYNKPSNYFVASFVGSPRMNFLDGEIVVSDGGIRVDFKNGTMDISGYAFDQTPQSGFKIRLGVRAEDMTLGGDSSLLSGYKIDLIEAMGPDSLAWCTDGSNTLSIKIANGGNFTAGSPVNINFSSSAISIFALDDGQRI
ncbi:sn-glycerol-3-phosphate ABC transporter ATP-binding protein UgpC [Pantoea vagans]|uniref:ABC transporter ATP-binding protein n=1 Tax=Pantoea vagans TaxID=470934 RepID=UPI003019E9FB